MPVCPVCGRVLEEDERFCYRCDVDVAREVQKDQYDRIEFSKKSIFQQVKEWWHKLKKRIEELKPEE
jgi:predicted nucleic acid-binding Zn ribbon protein